jgi:SAM-dependent methyltransferase
VKLGVIPDGLTERLALALGVVPTPMFQTVMGLILARAVLAGTRLGVFEALARAPMTAGELADHCGLEAGATEKLCNALVGAELLCSRGRRYALGPVARKWLLEASPRSLRDTLLFFATEAASLDHLEEFVRTGNALDFHRAQNAPEQWALYQRGMRSLTALSAREVAQRAPVPKRARRMLDIGGGHGLNSVALCRRHPALQAEILDLPEAIEQAAPLLAHEGMGDRVRYRPGNALTEELGSETYDLVLMSQLAHHFAEDSNRELSRRVARALRPGGVFVIQEVIRGDSGRGVGQVGALLDLQFALSSESGTWSLEELAAWQRDAGLVPRRPVWLRTSPGSAQQPAVKRAA